VYFLPNIRVSLNKKQNSRKEAEKEGKYGKWGKIFGWNISFLYFNLPAIINQ
jgi:hypothetical protein